MVLETVTRRSFSRFPLASSRLSRLVLRGVLRSPIPIPARAVLCMGASAERASRGKAWASSWGDVVLLDGSVLKAANVSDQFVGAGKSVLIASDQRGGWSILYAEL